MKVTGILMSNPDKTITRSELYEMVWTRPFVKFAQELGYSFLELVGICAELNIPRPGGGYLYRIAHGEAEERTPLPPLQTGTRDEIPYGTRTEMTAPEVVIRVAEKAPNESPKPNDREPLPENEPVLTAKVIAEIPPEAEPNPEADVVTEAGEVDREVRQEVIKMSREELHAALWRKPCLKVAAELGISAGWIDS